MTSWPACVNEVPEPYWYLRYDCLLWQSFPTLELRISVTLDPEVWQMLNRISDEYRKASKGTGYPKEEWWLDIFTRPPHR